MTVTDAPEPDDPSQPRPPVKLLCSARIAWLRSLPGRLRVDQECLELAVPLMGRYRLTPDEVVAIEPTFVGTRIEHIRPDVPRSISISALGINVAERIAAAGFVPRARRGDEPETGPALHNRFVALAVIVQLALGVAIAAGASNPDEAYDDLLGLAWLLAVFLASLLIRIEGPFRRFAVDSPLAFKRLLPFVNLTTLVSGFILVGLVFERLGW